VDPVVVVVVVVVVVIVVFAVLAHTFARRCRRSGRS
jgi:hypothetical protein